MVNYSVIYFILSLIILDIIVILEIFSIKKRKGKKSTKLASLAMTLVALGIIFGDVPSVGYGSIGLGVILGAIDIMRNLKKK